jgi:hypothetical protein
MATAVGMLPAGPCVLGRVYLRDLCVKSWLCQSLIPTNRKVEDGRRDR